MPDLQARWVEAFLAAGASQCGFCTPGILLRLAALENGTRPLTRQAVESALLAHLCRCTGWQSIVEAGCAALGIEGTDAAVTSSPSARAPIAGPAPAPDPLLAQWRAQIEGSADQTTGPEVVLGGGGFADDRAPARSLVQLGAADTPPADGLACCSRRHVEGAGAQQHHAVGPSGRRARGSRCGRGGVGAHAADDLGGTGLRRARCQLVPARRTSRRPHWPMAALSEGNGAVRLPRGPRLSP